jgi:membrane-bound lytic murein transglycosylase B
MRLRAIHFISSILFFAIVAAPLSFLNAETLTAAERAELEAELAEVQAEQAQAQAELAAAQSKSSSLQNDIKVLNAKIKTEQLDIQAKNLLIQTLGNNITTKQAEIDSLNVQIAKSKQGVADSFRQLQQSDSVSFVEIALNNGTLSDFFDDALALESLQQNLDLFSATLAAAEASSTAEKTSLQTAQDSASDVLYSIQKDQNSLKANQTEQQKLLSISKNNEKAYAAVVSEKKKQADQINARLFALAGGSSAIPFGTAYQYALSAQQKTGLDPAFLLAILTQESNLGSNQGTCYLTDTKTGTGVSAKSGKVFINVMSPTRDVPPFLKITSALNVDPMHTVVSCPQSIGWGGAMGPAQFIASTWLLFSDRVASALGFSGMANPWDPQDAFMASALYLTDLGAAKGGYTAESNAACRYYSGSPCSKSSLVASYGSSVMSLASTIQSTEIDKLQ